MWQLNSPWYDPILRAVIIYFFIFILVRFMGRKQLARFTPFEFVLLLIISEVILSGTRGEDRSPAATLITIGVLVGMNILMNKLTYHFTWFEKMLIGQPEVIILNGKMHKRVMKKERITEAELFEALREHEVMNSEDVKCAILETDGKISVIKYEH